MNDAKIDTEPTVTINVKVTKKEKAYYLMAADTNNLNMTQLVKHALRTCFGTVEDMKIDRKNLKEHGITINSTQG